MEEGAGRRRPSAKNAHHTEFFEPAPDSLFFLDPRARWDGISGFIAEEQAKRAERLRHQQELLARKREVQGRMERAKQQCEEAAFQEEQARLAKLQESKGKANKSQIPFDILTLDYHPTPEGRQLQQQDEERRVRAQQRALRLYERNNTVTHNIVTGAPPRPFPDSSVFSPV